MPLARAQTKACKNTSDDGFGERTYSRGKPVGILLLVLGSPLVLIACVFSILFVLVWLPSLIAAKVSPEGGQRCSDFIMQRLVRLPVNLSFFLLGIEPHDENEVVKVVP
eukprot:gnl/TRDRNA2_/TRDRNA2_195822_c0_seq1.p1 gnl/TRDRNA2_/TRDRNA2_195822_c0~~gnl/TRDRNA2_/TRDRNA2_195822_c0_seq1.p1  ORF type:complete len:109 (-),score=12.90 gnl/TRDRNA2_/TRDRNA2_195822_c0_seq1:102-428(-)